MSVLPAFLTFPLPFLPPLAPPSQHLCFCRPRLKMWCSGARPHGYLLDKVHNGGHLGGEAGSEGGGVRAELRGEVFGRERGGGEAFERHEWGERG